MSVVGTHVSNRRPADQSLINKVAKEYLNRNELNLLSKYIGVPVASLRFDGREAQILASRMPREMLQGDGAKGYHFAQFYDFVLTMDYVLSQVRALEVAVANMDDLGDAANRQYLDSQILAADFRPWFWHDRPPLESKTGGDATQGQQLGSKTWFDYSTGKNAAKDEAHLATDEAYVLSYPILNSLTALGQGLFKLYISTGSLSGVDRSGMWINSVQEHTQTLIHPKKLKGHAKIPIIGWVGQTNVPLTEQESGIVGLNDDVWEDKAKGPGGGKPKTEIFHNYGAIGIIPVGANGAAGTAQKMTDIYAKMSTSNGAIRASPRLAKAYRKSGVHQRMNAAYHKLQKLYTRARASTTLGLTSGSALDMVFNRNRGLNKGSNLACPPGMGPVYVGYDGKRVPTGKALITNSRGQKFVNTSLVDVDRSHCEDGMPGCGAMTLSEREMFGAMQRARFGDATGTKPFAGQGAVNFDARAMTLDDMEMYGAQMLDHSELFGANTKKKGKKKKSSKSSSTKPNDKYIKTRSVFYGLKGRSRAVYKKGNKMYMKRKSGWVRLTAEQVRKNNARHKAAKTKKSTKKSNTKKSTKKSTKKKKTTKSRKKK